MVLSSVNDHTSVAQPPVELLRTLIRFDTTNPPGNESACIAYINNLLVDAGFETSVLALDPERPNLITRLTGQGLVPPLLLYGHVDVVPAKSQLWQYPPFEGQVIDNFVWGRGSLDMKGGLAMMLAALLRAKAEGLTPPGDVVLAIVSDEEAGGDYGAKYLVENHAALFRGIHYALGEFGGFTLHFLGKRFYPIQVAEKQVVWLKATVRGASGHGSFSTHEGSMPKLANLIHQLNRKRMPVHITPVAQQMLETMASALPFPLSLVLRQLLNPTLTGIILKLLGNMGKVFAPLFYNTVTPTIIQGGEKINVVPSEITLHLDGRLLPGYSATDMIAELRRIVGDEVDLEIIRFDPGPAEPNLGLFRILGGILYESDPQAIPVPLLLPASTDACFFAQLGIQTYGFIPMNLPEGFDFWQFVHAADERIPVSALDFGTNALYKVLQRFGDAYGELPV